jgi:hypothetical protein
MINGDRKVDAYGDAENQSKVARLRPWLSNAQKNITHSKRIIQELNRIKVLDRKKEKMIVYRKDIVTPK